MLGQAACLQKRKNGGLVETAIGKLLVEIAPYCQFTKAASHHGSRAVPPLVFPVSEPRFLNAYDGLARFWGSRPAMTVRILYRGAEWY
jgi:hypothetical protein